MFSEGLIAAKSEALVLAARNDDAVLAATEQRDKFIGTVLPSDHDDPQRSPRQRITQRAADVTEYIRKRISEIPLNLRQEPYDFVFHVLYKEVGEKDLYNTFTRIREIGSTAYNASETSIQVSDANSYDDVCTIFLSSFDRIFNSWKKSLN